MSTDDAAVPLDMLLTEGARGPWRRLLPGGPAVRLAASLATRPATLARRGAGLVTELGKIGLGTSTVAAPERDPRYADPAWTSNPVLRRLAQAHTAAGETALDLVEDAGLDPADCEQVRHAVATAAELLAPATNPLFNPLAWRAAARTGGRSVVDGLRRAAGDLGTSPRVPAAADLTPGEDVAATPGAVVYRTEMVELVQYLPRDREVRDVPVLVVPPFANRFYLADLAPDRSLVEHLVRADQQVFALSWRNPGAEHAEWGLDAYAQALLDAMDACERICRVDRTILLGVSTGGLLVTAVLAHLAAREERERVAGLVLVGTVLDRAHARTGPTAGHPVDDRAARASVAASARRGYVDGRRLAELLAWLSPDELFWPGWAHGYLQGEEPAPDPLRYWNADATRVPAALHRDLVALALDNALAGPGRLTLLGTPLDLSRVRTDVYAVAGVGDRFTAWQAAYRTSQLVGGKTRFVLATGGNAAALATPPGSTRAAYRVGGAVSAGHPVDAERWRSAGHVEPGSWWPDLVEWLAEHTGEVRDAPPELGGRGLHAVYPAPGTYVVER
ncbi:MAG TPA: alpha/beta fold hydrolase [Pseudonocardia sp.]|nr:alpha/beta fold hydrolase [Pseudonocardia sp.]